MGKRLQYFGRMLHSAETAEQTDMANELATQAFARDMAKKLQKSRQRGRAGWHDPSIISTERLSVMLSNQFRTDNIDFVDIANLAMMLHFRKENPND